MTSTATPPYHPRDDGPAALAALITAQSVHPATNQPTTRSTSAAAALAQPDNLPPVLGVPAAARMLGISRTTAYSLINGGNFPCPVIRVGTRYKIPTAPLLNLLGLPAAPA